MESTHLINCIKNSNLNPVILRVRFRLIRACRKGVQNRLDIYPNMKPNPTLK